MPSAFQGEREVTASWVVKGQVLSFKVGPYDPEKPLIIDPPVRLWGAYYGGITRIWDMLV
ncbi:MAG: hypothetical protein IPJ40_03110 [Saprospirales bacterium]|nr:hypothetical protein [Saprospirales bacterium]